MTTESTETDNIVPENELARRRACANNINIAADGLLMIKAAYQGLVTHGMPTKDWLPQVFASLPPGPVRERLLDGADTAGPKVVDAVAAFLMSGGDGFLRSMMPTLLTMFLPEGSPVAAMIQNVMAGPMGESLLGRLSVGIPGEPGYEVPPPGYEAPRDADLDHADGSLTAARMRAMIRRLFKDAPRMLNADGTPDETQAPALECHVVLRGSIPPIQGVLSTTPEGGLRMMTPSEIEDPAAAAPAHPRATKPTKRVMAEQFFDYSDVVAIVVTRDVKMTPGSGLIS